MRIAILSDIHDNIWNLTKTIKLLQNNVDTVVCCGDFCTPFIPPYLTKLKVPIYACLGNNDEDHIGLFKTGGELFNWTHLSKEYGQAELGGKKIAFCHYPKLAELLAQEGAFDAVFHGHTHFSRIEKYNKTILVNPGAICGIQKGKAGIASYAIYDTSTNTAEIYKIT